MCFLDISHLTALISAAQEQDKRLAFLPVIHAVTGAMIDAQLIDTTTNALPIAK
jgi:hypothetical protein